MYDESAAAASSLDTQKGLRVRLLEEADTTIVRKIIRQHHETTVFRDQAFSDWKLNEHFQLILSRQPRMVCPVACLDGIPVGVAWAIADSYMLSDGPLFVTVQVIAVDLTLPPLRRAKIFLALVAAIRQWASTLNASHTFIHVTTGSQIESTDRLLKAAGAQVIGGAYIIK